MRSIRNNQVIVRKFKGKVSTVSPHMHVCMYVHPHAHNGANCMTFARSPVLSGANQNWPPWHGEWQCAVYGNPMLPSYWVPRTNLVSTVRQIGPAEAFLLDPAAFAGMPQPAVVAVADQRNNAHACVKGLRDSDINDPIGLEVEGCQPALSAAVVSHFHAAEGTRRGGNSNGSGE
jgi:hypothetical protein